jgi:branched-subunit amino acid ABC-type transport system permease component/ABC-type branched-subunit amino acid transport system ATPase component
MTEVLQFALLGLGTGAVYALLAEGIVLIFRGSGVLNLAHGAFAMFAAFAYYQLHDKEHWAMAPAMIAAVGLVVLIGVATDQLLLRRMRRASALTRLIATLGVLIVLQSLMTLKWGADPILASKIFPAHPVTIFGATVDASRFWMLAAAVAITVVLTLIWRYTRAGWVTVAVSENQRGAAALGWSPELVSSLTWAAGAGLAGIAGVLIAPVTQLTVTDMTFIIIPALAAALIGGFTSFSLTLVGGLLVGIAQAEVDRYVHQTGAADALPFLLIVLVLIARGSSLPLRGHVFDRLPEIGGGRVRIAVVAPLFVAMALLTSFAFSDDWLSALAVQFSVGIVLLSIVVLTGYAGQLSLAQFALAGIGALAAARLMAVKGWPFEPALLAAIASAMVVGLLFALPALRTRGVNLAIVTLGLGVATQAVVFNNSSYAGGWEGNDIGELHLFGWNIDFLLHPDRYTLVVFTVFVLCAIAVANLRRGRSGRRMIAVRANERAAAASGINVFAAKLHAFAVSGALAGLGGLFLAFQTPSVTFTAFARLASINAVAQATIGGIGYVMGAASGATFAPGALASLLGRELTSIDKYLPLIAGILLLLTLIANPNGIESNNMHLMRKLRAQRRRAPTRPALVEQPASERRRVAPLRLVVDDLTVRYGGVVTVSDVSLEVGPGEIVGLIGPNGAGKTSLMDAVSGFARYSGRVRLDDVGVDGWPAHRRARAGMGRSCQARELFEDMTAYENLQAASDAPGSWSMAGDLVWPGRSSLSPAAVAAVQEFGLTEAMHLRPSELSYGQRRLVAIARAVSMEPSVLLLDEPASGLDDRESAEFATLVRRLADEWGMAVLVVEHDMNFVMTICDRLVMIDFGREIAQGTPEAVRNDPAAIAAYLGSEVPDEDVAGSHGSTAGPVAR